MNDTGEGLNPVHLYADDSPVRRVRIHTTTGGIAAQLFFHEIHHRAQAMAMLRQLGVAAQDLDYSFLMYGRTDVPA